MADWADLSIDLLGQIVNHVKVVEDFVAFRSVCTVWRTAAPKDKFQASSPQVPLLMLADKDDDSREFYSFSGHKVSRIFLPEVRGRACFPSEGWLCTIEDNTGEINLLHPFSRTQIPLPSRKDLVASTGPGEEPIWSLMNKVVLSASPSFTSDYVLVVNYYADTNHLAFWRHGDLNWTDIKLDSLAAAVGLSYFKGQVYYVTWMGEFWIFDVAGPSTPKPVVEPRLLFWSEDDVFRQHSVNFYLVELSDALLFVTRYAHFSDGPDGGFKTFEFKVRELDVIKGELKEKIKTLGDSAIFLGFNSGACSVDSSKFTGIKPNHIYFTDDWYEEFHNLEGGGGRDMGAYNLEDGKIESFYPGLSLSPICPPTWVMPSLIM